MNDDRPVYGPPEPEPPVIIEPVRTDMDCTNCSRHFIAQLDLSLDGNHIISCPWCEHEHCRVVRGGTVTEDRWSSRGQRIDVSKMSVWKSQRAPIMTTTAAHFVRERWLNREDVQLA